MSGCGYQTYCPVCGNESVNAYSDHKPFPYESGECLDCGFNYAPKVGERMSLEEINDMRKDSELPRLTKKEYDKYKQKDFEII